MKCAFCMFSYMRAVRAQDKIQDAVTVLNGQAVCEWHWTAAENHVPGSTREFHKVTHVDSRRKALGEPSKP